MATDKNTKKRFSLLPPKKWRLPALIAIGAIIGFGLFIVYFGRVTDYMSDDPKACINCHVMTPHYMTWNKSSHREVATCNDCHVPHNSVFSKYYFKAKDGLYHSYVFTTHSEPQVIRAKDASIKVIHDNCIRCHIEIVTDGRTSATVANHFHDRTDRLCWDCHRGVPHSKQRGLSSIGLQIEPTQFDPAENHKNVPQWLEDELKKESKETNKQIKTNK
ncbi:respiratory nitrite reductase specific menaquinol--cytochrome-c reductase (NrfH) precursor [Capnocytophaga haemolytica]|uniref:Cytochrome C nitrite reductase n=1 Tax=Capnocytophaga haemolytica TaxID=45243 RepID=A0AAX2H135_9FLAO|nr:cytochrome c nitrite reductase small subunit [Capnocytophaga haemolytica]AMD86003.1 cytochrome C nitrite reductase [Capnocytophaga haemolytica]SFO26197.1 respiratory nitrite reductase specific menaquinol--cytochrome-c reductase (NrfH) precursor [Capnocytophaga haemolytica]SNV14841.1 Cytochrome c-type protein NrfH [Capnocytophaga haemolytica]